MGISSFDWDGFELLLQMGWGGAETFARRLGYDASAPAGWDKRFHEPRRSLLLSRLERAEVSLEQQAAFGALWGNEAPDLEALPSLVGDLRDVSPGGEPQAAFRADARNLAAQVAALTSFPHAARQRVEVALGDLRSYLGPFRRSLAAWTYSGLCDLHECAVLAHGGLPEELVRVKSAWNRLKRKGEEAARGFVSWLKQDWMRAEVELELERLANGIEEAEGAARRQRAEFLDRLERELQRLQSLGFAAGERGELTAEDFLDAHAQDLDELRARTAVVRHAWPGELSAPEEELEATAVFSADQLKEYEALLSPWQQRELWRRLLLSPTP